MGISFGRAVCSISQHKLPLIFGCLGGLLFLMSSDRAIAQGSRGPRPAVGEPKRPVVPRTNETHPDLEGTWAVATLTPFERPAEFADRPFLLTDEANQFGKSRLEADNGDRRGETPQADLASRAINEFWLERGPLAEVDGRISTSLIVDPPNGRLPAPTPEAQERVAARFEARQRANGPEDFTLSERCLRDPPWPVLLPSGDGSLVKIVQTRDQIVIIREKSGARIVPLDGRPHVGSSIGTWAGDSRGQWSGDTLVVDTTNFTHQFEQSAGVPIDRNLHLIERFTRIGPDRLRYEFTVDDSTAFTHSWTVVLPMRKTDEQIYEVACHEGNYALPNMMRGVRAQESSPAAAAAFSPR
jgi:hypothetical protein